MSFLFMAAGHIAMARDLGNTAETNNGITETYAHAPLLLAENLGRGQNAICKVQRSI